MFFFPIAEIALFIGTSLLAIYFIVPKSVDYFKLWVKTGKTIHVSNFAASLFVLLGIFSANFVIFFRFIFRNF